MKRILITGASGFIGRQAVFASRSRMGGIADEIHTVQHTARQMSDSRNHTVNLMDPAQVDRLMERVKPTHLLHLAWYAEHGKFWTSPLNLDWVSASLKLFQSFITNGGSRAVFAGTCAEYDWTQTPVLRDSVAATPASPLTPKAPQLLDTAEPALSETAMILNEETSPSTPSTLYGVCKTSLRLIVEKFAAQNNVSLAWGRIFFLYGPGEHPNRLIPSILNPLLNDQPATVRSGGHIRNFMHVNDVAAAFVHLLNSDATGIVNIADAAAISLGDVARLLGELTGKSHLLRIEQAPGTKENPQMLTADVSKLTALGFKPKFTLREGLATMIPGAA